jgi:putative ABC transport system substrate-binding protein
MEDQMKRRDFIALLSGALASPKGVLAEPNRKRAVIGCLSTASESGTAYYARPFLDGMRELGYAEGQDFEVVYRFADGHNDRLPELAAELVQLKPDIIFGPATAQAVVLKKITTTIPIVVAALAEPVTLGLIESDAHPGGNLTGVSPYVKGMPTKLFELAREIVPGATRVGLVDDVTDPKAKLQRPEIEEAAGKISGLKLLPVEVRTPDDIGPAFEALASEHVEQSSLLINARRQIAEAAMAKKLPSVYGYREHVQAGGLISYGIDIPWCFHRAAYYVDKILKGAKPADLPVEFPTKILLFVNVNTAKALDLTVPPSVLVRADEVIEG